MTKAEITGEPADPESFYTQGQTQNTAPYYAPQVNDNGNEFDEKSEKNKNEKKNNCNKKNSLPTANGAYYRSTLSSRLSALGTRAASPINMLANRMGSEGFLPETMYKECEKAARVLRGFAEQQPQAIQRTTSSMSSMSSSSQGKGKTPETRRALIHIPASVVQKAVGLAIFTTGRVGIHVSGATGSGVLIARRADGSWSPPSGIQVHTVGAGFILGADIYDCVLVLNTQEALEAFCSNTRLSLGSSLGVTAGPYGVGGGFGVATHNTAMDQKVPANGRSAFKQTMDRAVYSYIKSRGIYAGIKVDGTVVTSRQSANTAFYGAPVSVAQILRGEVPAGQWQTSAQVLLDAVHAAEAEARWQYPPAMPPRPAQYEQYSQQQYQQYQQYPQQYAQQPGEAYPQQWYAPAPSPAPVQTQTPTPTASTPQEVKREIDGTPVVSPVASSAVTATPLMTSAMAVSPVTPSPAAATPAARSKEQEAAEEAAANNTLPPPTYSQLETPAARGFASPTNGNEELPPYVDDNQVHPGVGDTKAELQ